MPDSSKSPSAAELHEVRQRAQAVYEIASRVLVDTPEPDLETQARLARDLRAALGSDELVARYLASKSDPPASEDM